MNFFVTAYDVTVDEEESRTSQSLIEGSGKFPNDYQNPPRPVKINLSLTPLPLTDINADSKYISLNHLL